MYEQDRARHLTEMGQLQAIMEEHDREQKQMLARIPIIALSANVFDSDMRRSAESGMDARLPKPLDVPRLLEAIRTVGSGQAR